MSPDEHYESEGQTLPLNTADKNPDGYPKALSLRALRQPEEYSEEAAITELLRQAVNSTVFAGSFALQLSRNPEVVKWQLQRSLDKRGFKNAMKLDMVGQVALVQEELNKQVGLMTQSVVSEFNKDLDNDHTRIHTSIRRSLSAGDHLDSSLKRLDRDIPEDAAPKDKSEMREDIMASNSILEPMRSKFKLRDTLTGFLRSALRRSLGLAIYHMTDDTGERLVPQNDKQDMYEAAFLMFDDLFEGTGEKSAGRAKMECLDEFVGLPLDFVREVAETVDKPLSVNVYEAIQDDYKWFGARARKAMLEFAKQHKNELTESAEAREHFKTTLNIYYEMLSNPDIELYFLKDQSTDLQLLEGIFEACQSGQIHLNGLFCPDWSGVEEQGMWKYTFENVGEEVGTVARKGMQILTHLHSIFSKYLSKVEVRLDYPTFECPLDGYKDDKTGNFIERSEFHRRLRVSGQKAQEVMGQAGVQMMPGTTGRLFSDEGLFADKERMLSELKQGIIPEGFTQQEWQALVEKTYEARKNFYPRWYPKGDLESPDAYERRLKEEVVPLQLFEYWLFQRHYKHRQPNTILVMADNSFMGTSIAKATGVALFSGQAKGSLGYEGQ